MSKTQLQRRRAWRQVRNDYQLYLMLIPVIAFYLIFKYWPMYGVQIAFRDYNVGLGFLRSEWVGLDNFTRFFSSYRCGRLISNTVLINVLQLIFQFPLPIIFAIFVNEVSRRRMKTFIMNVTYIPHFLSTVVVIGLLSIFFNTEYGLVNQVIKLWGGDTVHFLESAGWFRPLFIGSGIWQHTGWNSMIYLGALAGIDPTLYEAAQVDGASKWQQIGRITLPCIVPTIITMLILKLGSIMDLGVDKVLLMQNDLNRSTSDVLSVYVYKEGIREGDYSYAAAVDLFNNVINFAMVLGANKLSKHVAGTSLW
ncbi:MAG: ABC transporter permease [Aristaeellaceae bacterium]